MMEGVTEKVLFNCRVKYIGTSEPTRKVQGVEAVQEPLRSVYGYIDNDIDKFESRERKREIEAKNFKSQTEQKRAFFLLFFFIWMKCNNQW